MGDANHAFQRRAHPRKRSRRQDPLVLSEQIPLFEIFEENGEEVREPVCGGCGKCAYTPLARSPRVRKRKP
jgi:hypothetical protein